MNVKIVLFVSIILAVKNVSGIEYSPGAAVLPSGQVPALSGVPVLPHVPALPIVPVLPNVSFLKSSAKSDQITDCYYRHEYTESVIELICSDTERDGSYLFTPDVKTVCFNQPEISDYDDGISKRWIENIEFQNCERPKIPKNLFELYPAVDTFNMAYLGLTKLQFDDWANVKTLRILNVSHNELTELPKSVLQHFSGLTTADLSFNQISKVDAEAFSPTIRYLYLGHNDIGTLTVEMFEKLVEMKRLYLNHNQITEIPRFVLHKMNELVEVDFSFNQIGKIEVYAFSGHFILETMNLAHNRLTNLERKIFRDENLKNLLHLNVSSNLIEEIHPSTFSTLRSLQTLDLSNNKLKTLDANILTTRASHLKLLAIKGNGMAELNGFTNSRIPNATIVGISEFNCTYFNTLFKSLTWKHVDTVLKLLECKTIEEGTDFKEDSNETVAPHTVVDDDNEGDSSCTFYLITSMFSVICLMSIVSAAIWFVWNRRFSIGNAFTGVSYSNNKDEPISTIVNQ